MHATLMMIRIELDGSGRNLGFFVRSTYSQLCRNEYGHNFKQIWKAKLPLELKVFMCLSLQEAILTKYSVQKETGTGVLLVPFAQKRNV